MKARVWLGKAAIESLDLFCSPAKLPVTGADSFQGRCTSGHASGFAISAEGEAEEEVGFQQAAGFVWGIFQEQAYAQGPGCPGCKDQAG